MNQPLLTICIPTYSRDMMLNNCLAALYNIHIHGHLFNLVVGDNGSTDATQDVIAKWKPQFSNFQVISHKDTIGFDRNAASLYRAVQTEYCWLLGDCDTISEQNFIKIEQHLTKGYDALVINTDESMLCVEKKVYTDILDFLNEQGWHVTKLSACIIRRELLEEKFIKRYFDSHFVHWGNLMESLCQKDTINVLFDPNIPLGYLVDNGNYRQSQKGAWRQIPFYVWGRCWSQMVLALPIKIPYSLKLKVIKDHERNYHWFSIKNLIKNKIRFGESYIDNYKENRHFVRLVTVASSMLSDIVMYLPIELILKPFILLHQRMLRMK